MTVGTEFFDWQRKSDDPAYNHNSPNLMAIRKWMADTWGTTTLGCYGERAIRDGVAPSSHSHGAAEDNRYGEGIERRRLALNLILPTLINNSAELGIQAIHDYIGSRIWRAGRNDGPPETWWKAQPKSTANGMGQSWAVYFHIETTLSAWGDSRPVDDRFGAPAPVVPVVPTPPVEPSPVPEPPADVPVPPLTYPVTQLGDTGDYVGLVQTLLRDAWGYFITVDWSFGPKTKAVVEQFQKFHHLTADGIVGKNTWSALRA